MFALIEGIKNIYRARLASMAVALLIGAFLAVGGWYYILSAHLHTALSYVERALVAELFLFEDSAPEQTEAIGELIRRQPFVAAAAYISKDSAAAIFRNEVGEDIQTLTGGNPLPPSFRVTFVADSLQSASLDTLTGILAAIPGVEDVVTQREYLLALLRYDSTVKTIHIAAGIILLFAALGMTGNVIGLSVHHRRKSIEIMKLIGATNRFISAPYLIEGFTVGTFGGVIGAAAVYAGTDGLSRLLEIRIAVQLLLYPSVVAAGACIGLAGSWFAVRAAVRRI